MADFAKTQLMKFGWTEGKGLGKHENGITQALKPKLKNNTEGIGHRLIDTDQWWESMFNKAAKNLEITSDTNGISISSKNMDSINLNKESKVADYRKTYYSNFLQTCTLEGEKLIRLKSENAERKEKKNDETNEIPILSDEELFKACGGRTAHKGARHGLNLSGKLARIAEQEKITLDNIMKSIMPTETTNRFSVLEKIENEHHVDVDRNANAVNLFDTDKFIKCKATRKKEKRKINNLSHLLSVSCSLEEVDKNKSNDTINNKRYEKLKRKRDKHSNEDDIDLSTLATHNDVSANNHEQEKSKKKKKRHHKETHKDNLLNINNEANTEVTNLMYNIKAKKNKHKKSKYNKLDDIDSVIIHENIKCKNSKKHSTKNDNTEVIKLMEGFNDPDDENKNEIISNNIISEQKTKEDSDRLNYRILKKKRNRLRKKEKRKFNPNRYLIAHQSNIQEDKFLMNMNINKKSDTTVQDLIAANIVEDVSEKLTKSVKESKKGKRKLKSIQEDENCNNTNMKH